MAQSIHSVIQGVLKDAQHQHGVLFAVQRQWNSLVGKALAAHSRPVSLRSKRLVVHVDRPGDGFTLNYRRAHLMERLKIVTQGRVEELIIRPGDVPSRKQGETRLKRGIPH